MDSTFNAVKEWWKLKWSYCSTIIPNVLSWVLELIYSDIFCVSSQSWGETNVCFLWSHLHFPKGFKKPHQRNSSASGQKCDAITTQAAKWRWSLTLLVFSSRVERYPLYNLTQYFQKVLKRITFVHSTKIFRIWILTCKKHTHGHWGISSVAAT